MKENKENDSSVVRPISRSRRRLYEIDPEENQDQTAPKPADQELPLKPAASSKESDAERETPAPAGQQAPEPAGQQAPEPTGQSKAEPAGQQAPEPAKRQKPAPAETTPKNNATSGAVDPPKLVLPSSRVLHPESGRRSVRELPQRVQKTRREEALVLIEKYRNKAIRQGQIPIPGLDLMLIARLQLEMLNKLAKQFGFTFSLEENKSLLDHWMAGYKSVNTGLTILGSAFKWVPYIGKRAGSSSVAAGAGDSTLAMGKAFLHYLETLEPEEELTIEDLSAIFLTTPRRADESPLKEEERPD